MARASYCWEVRSALSPSLARSSASVVRRSNAAAMPATDCGATSSPLTSCSMISRGPEAQSKLATGSPAAIASWTTSGKPSVREVSAATDAFAHSAAMSVTAPGSSTRSLSPRFRISRARRFCSGPVPQIRSRQSGTWSAISANAATSSSNCFSDTSRPAVRISGLSSWDRGWTPSGSGLGITTVGGHSAPS